MRRVKLAVAIAAGLLVGSPLLAQPPGGFGGPGGGGNAGLASSISQNKKLQEELKVESGQLDKLAAALAKVREDLRDDSAKLRDRNTPAAERTEITTKIREANAKAVSSILSADQLKRLHQIENQQGGLGAFAKEDMQKALKLTDEQKERVTTITKELDADRRELFGAGPGGGAGGGNARLSPEAMTKWQELQKEAKAKVLSALTDDQKTAFKDLTGAPFDLGQPTFGGGGFGGAGGGGGFGGFAPTPPGKILSTNVQNTLKLSDEQKKQLEDLQKELDGKLEKILTDEQKKQLQELKDRPAGGFGQLGGGRPRQKKE